MKKTFIIAACWVCFFLISYAGTYNPFREGGYEEYVGKYLFDDAGPVKQVEVFLKDTLLTYRSDSDTGQLTRIVADSFSFKGNYEGTLMFRRDAQNHVNGQTVYVAGQILEAQKAPASTTGFYPAAGKNASLVKASR